MTQPVSQHATERFWDASATKRLVVRQEVLNGKPAVLFIVEYDHELGAPECSADELLTAVGQVVARADAI